MAVWEREEGIIKSDPWKFYEAANLRGEGQGCIILISYFLSRLQSADDVEKCIK